LAKISDAKYEFQIFSFDQFDLGSPEKLEIILIVDLEKKTVE
jgi:hypothetical protein